jgi:hypothetical protein
VKPLRLAAACGACAVLAAPVLPAQAQMFHLILQCEGQLAAGLVSGGSLPEPGATPRAVPPPAADTGSDKNTGDENLQVRAKAVRSAAKRGNANLELALRDNNMTAFVQRSNVLPTGERMKYVATQSHYTAVFTPPAGTVAVIGRNSWLLSFHPPFQKMMAARFAIDRQTGVLEGDLVGPNGEVLGLLDMQCEPKKEGQGPAPRF